MELITERTKVHSVLQRWRRQYPVGRCAKDKQLIGDRLALLDLETATAQDVAAIIGNDSWCGPEECNECGQKVPVAVQLGEEPNYESRTAVVCADCLQKACGLLLNAKVTGLGGAND